MFILVPDRSPSGRYQATQLLTPEFLLLVNVLPYERRTLPCSCFMDCNEGGKRRDIGFASPASREGSTLADSSAAHSEIVEKA